MNRPDGAVELVRAASSSLGPRSAILLGLVGWLSFLLGSPLPLALCALCAAWTAWLATRPPAEATEPRASGWRLLTRALIAPALACAIWMLSRLFSGDGNVPYGGDLASLIAAGGAGLAFLLALWRYLASLTWPGFAPRRAVDLRGAGLAALAAGLLGVALYVARDALWVPAASRDFHAGLFYWAARAAAVGSFLSPLLLRVAMDPFREAPPFEAGALAEALEARLCCPAEVLPEGVWVVGSTPAGPMRLRVDLRRLPAWAEIETVLPAGGALSRIRVRARKRGERGGIHLQDPLLHGTLLVEGVSPEEAEALLTGLHEPLLTIFHAYPSAALRGGRLVVALAGPPFAPGQNLGESADFLAGCMAECSALAAALQAQTPPPAPEPQPAPQRARQAARAREG